MAALATEPDLNVLDLAPALQALSSQYPNPVYRKTDTHWNGKGAWIAAMVLGFVFFWPVGLALLAYMIWGKRMFRSCRYALFAT